MATWNGAITNAGNTLLNEWVNEKTLSFDSAVAGQGTVPLVSLLAQTALVSQKQVASLLSGEKVTSGIRLKLRITAPDAAYTLNQLGIMASVDSGTSTLLALFQLDQGVPIPSKTESPDFVYTFYALISCSNTGTWTVTVDSSACVTQGDMDAAIAAATATKADKTALDAKADIVNPEFTGSVKVKSATAGVLPIIITPTSTGAIIRYGDSQSSYGLNIASNGLYANQDGDNYEIYTAQNKPPVDRIVAATSTDGTAYTATVNGVTELYAGLTITIIPSRVSSSTAPTLNINNLGAKSIKMSVGYTTAMTQVAPVGTWLSANKPIKLIYDGIQWKSDLQIAYAEALWGAVPIAKGGTGATTADIALINLGAQALHKKTTIMLSQVDWDGETSLTKSVTGVTSYNTVMVSPAPSSYQDYVDCGLRCTAQGNSSLTFTCETIPTVASLTINVVILD